MEVRSERDKSELSSNDSSTFSAKSLKLGVCSRSRLKSLSASASKLEASSRDHLLASIGNKLKANNIQLIISKNLQRMSDPCQAQQVAISCFPEGPPSLASLTSLSSVKQITPKNYLEYEQLVRRPRLESQMMDGVHAARGDRVGCFEQACEVKRKWTRSILFYQKEVKNLYLLRERRGQLPPETADQIQKDVGRTFPSRTITKTKINVIQSEVEKYDHIETLRQVLRLYAVYDSEVGYVQGMNMVAAPIVMHMRDMTASFIYFKEIMTYGKLRLFFIEEFSGIKQEVREKFRKLLRFHNIELYQYFEESGVDYTMFVPYYITLFATLVEIPFMHMVINEFMRGGVAFLHRFFLALLLFLKQRILEDIQGEGVLSKLGTTYIKSLHIDWRKLLALTPLINFG